MPVKVRDDAARSTSWFTSRSACSTANRRRLAALNAKSETSPITPITMIPKMICPVFSSAWLSVIMWPMPDDEPISSATIT